MSRREELVDLLADAMYMSEHDCADAIIAAGYRKPRVINTFWELNELPVGAVIRDAEPAVLELGSHVDSIPPTWYATFPDSGYAGDFGYSADQIVLPATVLYDPTEGITCEVSC